MHFITSVKLTGYSGFFGQHCLNLAVPRDKKPGSGLTILVGPNGGGKSSLLEAIYIAASNRIPQLPFELFNEDSSQHVEFQTEFANRNQLSVVSSKENPRTLEASAAPGPIPQRPVYFLRRRDITDVALGTTRISRKQYLSELGGNVREGMVGNTAARMLHWTSNGGFLKTAQTLISKQLKLTVGQDSRLMIKERGFRHPFTGVGRGYGAGFWLIDSLYDADDSDLVLIDEPELALHPRLQRRFARYITEQSQRLQIVIATHSPYFADWEMIANGARIARVHRKGDSGCHISQLTSETANACSAIFNNSGNPHTFGLQAREALFIDDGLVLVEGQDDAIAYRQMLEQLDLMDIADHLFGWGVGGAENMHKVVAMFKELGVERIIGLLDNNKTKLAAELVAKYPDYRFECIPANDVRDKGSGEHLRKGLCDAKGIVHTEYKGDMTAILDGIAEFLQVH